MKTDRDITDLINNTVEKERKKFIRVTQEEMLFIAFNKDQAKTLQKILNNRPYTIKKYLPTIKEQLDYFLSPNNNNYSYVVVKEKKPISPEIKEKNDWE